MKPNFETETKEVKQTVSENTENAERTLEQENLKTEKQQERTEFKGVELDEDIKLEYELEDFREQQKEEGNPNWESITLEQYLAEKKKWSERVLCSTKLGKNMKEAGIERVENCQAHHLIPDEVVREHPLTRKLCKEKGTEYFDRAENGIFLPSTKDNVHPSVKDLPRHRGSHPKYSQMVRQKLNRLEKVLVNKYGSIENIPSNVLEVKIQKLQTKLKQSIETHRVSKKDGRLC